MPTARRRQGDDLIPINPDLEYDEADAFSLCCFAGTYREVRGKLQATRIGRDQETFRPGKGSKVRKPKGGGKGNRRPFTPGQPLRKPTDSGKTTLFKDKPEVPVIVDQLVICLSARSANRCGKLDHISRSCSLPDTRGSTPVRNNNFYVLNQNASLCSLYGLACVVDLAGSKSSVVSDQRDGPHGSAIAPYTETRSILAYPLFGGLATSPCHALVDTGAQEGVVGLWHWQRWIICLALCFDLKPMFRQVPVHAEAGGIGGAAKVVAVCEMPCGIAGMNALTTWVVLDEPDDSQRVPPLLPIRILKDLDAVHEPKHCKLTLRMPGVTTILDELDTGHQTTLMTRFDHEGWSFPEVHRDKYKLKPTEIHACSTPII